jgi:hypothetical protein
MAVRAAIVAALTPLFVAGLIAAEIVWLYLLPPA